MAVLGRVLLDPGVERQDPRHRPTRRLRGHRLGPHVVVADGQDARKHHPSAVRRGELRDGGDVLLDVGVGHRTGVAGDVVGAGEQDDDLRLQGEHVGAQPDEHLRRRLPADAAVDVALPGEEAAIALVVPRVGDRIAEEHDVDLRARPADRGGVVAVARELRPVTQAGIVADHVLQRPGHLRAVGHRSCCRRLGVRRRREPAHHHRRRQHARSAHWCSPGWG